MCYIHSAQYCKISSGNQTPWITVGVLGYPRGIHGITYQKKRYLRDIPWFSQMLIFRFWISHSQFPNSKHFVIWISCIYLSWFQDKYLYLGFSNILLISDSLAWALTQESTSFTDLIRSEDVSQWFLLPSLSCFASRSCKINFSYHCLLNNHQEKITLCTPRCSPAYNCIPRCSPAYNDRSVPSQWREFVLQRRRQG